jgi:Protein of unknown function (DUF3093)
VATEIAYQERLSVAWWLWPAALAASALVAAELGIGAFALRSPLTYLASGLLALGGLMALNRIRIAVGGGELRVDDAHVPLSAIGQVTVLDAQARRDLLGQDADPLAFVIQRPWIPCGVRVDLNDPEDPTPYWYVSSRRPAELAAVLRSSGRSVTSR